MITPEDADRMSRARARKSSIRIKITAAFAVLAVLLLALLFERQQVQLAEFVVEQCELRKADGERINATWDALTHLTRMDPTLPDHIREERLKVYVDAKLPLPDCGL